jgi:hypothetical protein
LPSNCFRNLCDPIHSCAAARSVLATLLNRARARTHRGVVERRRAGPGRGEARQLARMQRAAEAATVTNPERKPPPPDHCPTRAPMRRWLAADAGLKPGPLWCGRERPTGIPRAKRRGPRPCSGPGVHIRGWRSRTRPLAGSRRHRSCFTCSAKGADAIFTDPAFLPPLQWCILWA